MNIPYTKFFKDRGYYIRVMLFPRLNMPGTMSKYYLEKIGSIKNLKDAKDEAITLRELKELKDNWED